MILLTFKSTTFEGIDHTRIHMIKTSLPLLLFLIVFSSYSQVTNKSFKVIYSEAPINIDASLDEAVWEKAIEIKDFQQNFPSDKIKSIHPTIIKMAYNEQYLYIGIKAIHKGDKYVIPSLKRDYRAGGNDNISLLFDTFNDGSNAFLFGINPYGVRREALISGGGQNTNGFTTSWDVKWEGTAKIYDGYYIAEMAIPMSSFKFKEGEKKWRFNSYKFDMLTNEVSTWIPIPQNQLVFNLAFMGDMVFEKPLGKSKSKLAVIPYTNISAQKNFETDERKNKANIGGDVKVAVGNAMNLDITINPDFSNVEVDNLVTNLTRFEIALPERRQFFIDNSDLFSSFGGRRDANPFFSRRIGIAKDTSGTFIENRILGGVRLSGKINKDWRLGLMSIQTEKDNENEIASNNNSMFALQRKVFSRSNISMFFINRQAFGNESFLLDEDRFNRVAGIDYNLASADNEWSGKMYIHKSFDPDKTSNNISTGAFLMRNKRKYSAFFDAVYIEDDFNSDLGFIRRTDILKFAGSGSYRFYPEKSSVTTHGLELFGVTLWRPSLDYQNTDHDFNATYFVNFKDQSEINLQFSNRYVYLTDEFDPTGTDGVPLVANTEYKFSDIGIQYQTDNSKAFFLSLNTSVGQFFNGNKFSVSSRLLYRIQPKTQLSLNLNYDHIDLPDPHSRADIWLVSPRVDISFTKSIFWTTLFQYSNRQDNLGINSRLQWRFAPLSDLYLVYTDNYFVNSFEPRSRSINLKLTYWLNI